MELRKKPALHLMKVYVLKDNNEISLQVFEKSDIVDRRIYCNSKVILPLEEKDITVWL